MPGESSPSGWHAGTPAGSAVPSWAGEVDAEYDPEVIAYLYTGVGNFIGMRWADWTAGGQVPADVLEDLLNVLDHGLPPWP